MDLTIGSWFVVIPVFGVSVYVILSYLSERNTKEKYKELIRRKRATFQQKVENMKRRLEVDGELLTDERKRVLSYPILDLLQKLKMGELTPLAVLEAYQANAIIATEKTNCIVDFCEESTDTARNLESIPRDKRGPLYGIPLSIKECFHVKGYDHTAGLAKEIGKPSLEDGSFVKVMRNYGAIPFCITNIPQTMFSYACSNPVYGCTTNPFDSQRTPGGSSGGEACLIAQGGSILGVGSDVGGSLRIPAHFCGITALKPTYGRVCERGRDTNGAVGIFSNAGFMCKSVDGVILGMKTILENPTMLQDIDHSIVPIPWRDEMYNPTKKLKIGWYDADGFMEAVPGCKRAVAEAVKLLSSRGYEVIQFQPPDLDIAQRDFFRYVLGDLGRNNLVRWKGEILDQSIEVNNIVYKVPFWLRTTVGKFILQFVSRSMSVLADCSYHFTGDLWNGIKATEARKEKLLKAWKQAGVDIVIGPGFIFPAPPLNHPARLVPAVNFTAVYNVLNLPVGSVPITKYTKEDEDEMKDYPTDDILYKLIKSGTKGAIGLPLNVQVIGKPWHEEGVLRVMKELEESANYSSLKSDI